MYDQVFMSAVEEVQDPDIVIGGIPFDGTVSWRPGTRFGPNSIRRFSYAIETYSPYQEKDLEDYILLDIGNCPNIRIGKTEETLKGIEIWIDDIKDTYKDVPFLFFGGEHLIAYPIIKSIYKDYSDLFVVHIDAHLDLRKEYEGNKYSHATVMHLVKDIVGRDSFIQMGVRSGTREEFEEMERDGGFYDFIEDAEEIKEIIDDRPVYISLDLDVLDPSVIPGVGTPEPGGWTFNDLLHTLMIFDDIYVIGMDIVELSPFIDNTGVSSVVGAKVAREAILLMVR